MKLIQYFTVAACSLLFAASNSFAGVDSSGGGGSRTFSMSSGFTPGAFNIHLMSSSDGVLDGVIKYFKLAGAQPSPMTGGTVYVLDSTSVFQSNKPPGIDSYHYQMNMTIAYADFYEVSSAGEAASIEFRGPLAVQLYEAMEKNGAEMIARNIGKNGEIVGLTLKVSSDFVCSKRAEGGLRGSTSCRIRVSTKLPPKDDASCAECGG